MTKKKARQKLTVAIRKATGLSMALAAKYAKFGEKGSFLSPPENLPVRFGEIHSFEDTPNVFVDGPKGSYILQKGAFGFVAE